MLLVLALTPVAVATAETPASAADSKPATPLEGCPAVSALAKGLDKLIKEPWERVSFEAVPLPAGVALPEDDLPILRAAIGMGATHLLTGDVRHFGTLLGKKIARIEVLRPAEYLRRHRS
jgi:hypothetical protein